MPCTPVQGGDSRARRNSPVLSRPSAPNSHKGGSRELLQPSQARRACRHALCAHATIGGALALLRVGTYH
jgi:hypothetical protein